MVTLLRRYGRAGHGKFPYWVEATLNGYIVYAPSLVKALQKYMKHHTYEPYSIRLMADNE